MSVILDVADAVVATLNAPGDPGFSQPFTAERKYQPVFELGELETLRVSVVPKSVAITTASRHSNFFDCAVSIGVQKKIDTNAAAQLDALIGLVEEIVDHLRLKRLETLPEAMWLKIEHEPVFAPEHLEQKRVFTAVVTVAYRVGR